MGQLVFIPLLYLQKAVKKQKKIAKKYAFIKLTGDMKLLKKYKYFFLNDGFTKYLVIAQSIQLKT